MDKKGGERERRELSYLAEEKLLPRGIELLLRVGVLALASVRRRSQGGKVLDLSEEDLELSVPFLGSGVRPRDRPRHGTES
jgi:hypothetical protein